MRHFRLGDAALAALAAGRPSPGTLAELRRAQISRHLLLLTEIVRHYGGKPPPWYADPATRDTLADPMAALHTAATLTALREGTPPPPDRIAAPRHPTATHDGLTLRVRLEDTDPLRAGLGLTPTGPLSDAEAAHWQRLLAEAWQLLVARHRPAAEILAQVLSVLVPIEPDPGAGGLSATSAHAVGAVALSTPADPTSLAVALIHETQHSLLNATRTLFDLVHPDAATRYSPWRDDPRPAFGLLHGAYAYLAVTRFWRTETTHWAATPPRPDASATTEPANPEPANPEPANPDGRLHSERGVDGRRLAEFEFARWRAAVAETADALLGPPNDHDQQHSPPTNPTPSWVGPSQPRGYDNFPPLPTGHVPLTEVGARFVRALRDEVHPWLTEPVDPHVARLADWANAEHRARWRLRNLTVDPAAAARSWRDGSEPPAAALRPDGGGRALGQSERLRLVHRVLREGAHGLHVQPGDLAYLGGEAGTALDAYLEELESLGRPTRPEQPPTSRELEIWAGVAVVTGHDRPELLRAAHLVTGDLRTAGGRLNSRRP